MKYVVIVNGKPGTGKTTFEKYCEEYLDDCNMPCEVGSSINPMKDILKQMGWNGDKTDETRKMLSDLKDIWIRLSNGPTAYIVRKVMESKYDPIIFFFDIREADEIEKIVNILDVLYPLGIVYRTVLIKSPNERTYIGNTSDDGVYDYTKYTDIIDNCGTLEDLQDKAINFIDEMMYK